MDSDDEMSLQKESKRIAILGITTILILTTIGILLNQNDKITINSLIGTIGTLTIIIIFILEINMIKGERKRKKKQSKKSNGE